MWTRTRTRTRTRKVMALASVVVGVLAPPLKIDNLAQFIPNVDEKRLILRKSPS